MKRADWLTARNEARNRRPVARPHLLEALARGPRWALAFAAACLRRIMLVAAHRRMRHLEAARERKTVAKPRRGKLRLSIQLSLLRAGKNLHFLVMTQQVVVNIHSSYLGSVSSISSK